MTTYPAPVQDGIYLQVGSPPPDTTPPPTGTTTTPTTTSPTTTSPTAGATGGQGSVAPAAKKTVVAVPVSGAVTTTCPGRGTRPLTEEESTRLGCVVDATKGHVVITAAKDAAGRTQTAQFYDGAFKISQVTEGGRLLTIATLAGPPPVCAKRATAAARKPVKPVKRRKLWGSGVGAFRTQGRYGTATVRGTLWYTEDNCNGTLVRVRRGVVAVRSFVLRKTVTVKAGHSYLAPARRPARR